ncbi:ABC transporter family protein [Histomonas meleagridis]|nr:ABC transporter family protein [Histomonas meleagridis]
MAKRDATKEMVIKAAKKSNALNFIEKLEGKFNYFVGEKGDSVSGGQRQRIAIARALIRDPVILLTDEATSALDAESEKKVQLALNKVMKNRTSVVVAHRLSTIQNANIIYLFDSGEIREKGTHSSLIKKKGYYYELVKMQMKEEHRKMNK